VYASPKPVVRLAAPVLAALLAGCAGTPQQFEVKEVYVCAADQCGPAGRSVTASQMLQAMYNLLQRNDGKDYTFCSSDPQTRGCESEGVCHFVQGGPIPGIGCQARGNLSQIKIDGEGRKLLGRGNDYKTFIAVPLVCVSHDTTVSVRTVDEITLEATPYYCNWMGVGNMSVSFNLAVDFVDFDRGRLGGYYSHAVAGNAFGKGSGYALLQFAEPMPRGQNWLAQPRTDQGDSLPRRP
jgi:hypothetical protein